MADESTVWHYGLMAERWAEFVNEVPELPDFSAAIQNANSGRGRFGFEPLSG